MGKNWRRVVSSKCVLWGLMGAFLLVGLMSIPGFLAVNDPTGEGVLVVEAWIPAGTLAESVNVFNSRRYGYLVVVGEPVAGRDSPSHQPTTYADLAARRLEKLGFDTTKLVRINAPAEPAGLRTFASGAAVKRWLSSSGISFCCAE